MRDKAPAAEGVESGFGSIGEVRGRTDDRGFAAEVEPGIEPFRKTHSELLDATKTPA